MSHNKLILLLILVLGLRSEAPVPAQDTLPATVRSLGKVLVLDNEGCLEGEIEVVDDQYCVRQGISEVWLSGKKVLRVCPDWNAAYQFVKQRANLDDPDERVRIARWCQKHGMLQEGLLEAKIAQDMRPLHTETQHLVLVLKGSLNASKSTPTPMSRPAEAIDSVPAPDLIPEAVAFFTTRVQPILLNTCVHCHSGGKGGDFHLYRTSDGGHQLALQRNLKAVVNQIRFDNPQVSPLLIKAVSPHGATSTAALSGKKSTPYRTLENWVNGVVKSHPHLKEQYLARHAAEHGAPPSTSGKARFGEEEPPSSTHAYEPLPVTPATPLDPGTPAAPVAPVAKKDSGPIVPMTSPERGPMGTASVPASMPAAPARKMEPPEADEYSAAEFNRLVHPSRLP